MAKAATIFLMSKLCPTAQPGMDRCQVLGVVDHDGPAPVVRYLSEPVEATPELLATAAPLKPTGVLRLSATCAEHRCPHFDGMDCKLVSRIIRLLPAVVDSLPPCVIRQECRWYSQEGGAACKRCPGIATVSYDLSPEMIEVSGSPVFPRSDCERAHELSGKIIPFAVRPPSAGDASHGRQRNPR